VAGEIFRDSPHSCTELHRSKGLVRRQCPAALQVTGSALEGSRSGRSDVQMALSATAQATPFGTAKLVADQDWSESGNQQAAASHLVMVLRRA